MADWIGRNIGIYYGNQMVKHIEKTTVTATVELKTVYDGNIKEEEIDFNDLIKGDQIKILNLKLVKE